MRYLAMLVMLLGIGLFTIGCTAETPPAPTDGGTPDVQAPADDAGEAAAEKAEGAAEEKAEGAAEEKAAAKE